jgi:hypothetical protein
MKCPDCGTQHSVPVERCPCGHEFSAGAFRPLYEESEVEPVAEEPPVAPNPEPPFRRCAKCGSLMGVVRVDHMFINGVIPSGRRLYFRCVCCGKAIKLRSLWRNLLVGLAGCFLFGAFIKVLSVAPAWAVGIIAAVLAVFPLMLLSEIVTRARYPTTMPGAGPGEEEGPPPRPSARS